MNRLSLAILHIVLCAYLGACTVGLVPVIDKSPDRLIPPKIKVLKGDSLYSIAWQFGLDYQKIAKWNGLKKPYLLRVGQSLQLRPPKTSQSTTLARSRASPSATTVTRQPVVKRTLSKLNTPTRKTPSKIPAQKQVALPTRPPKTWNWPAKGKVISKFSPNKGDNGINITGAPGSAVRATASGRVVYTGEGLRGYGKLIIVKHSTSYLSAYAHNRSIMVKEGQNVRGSQQIARMGQSDASRTMLHFEIRKDGKPVDPLKFLRR